MPAAAPTSSADVAGPCAAGQLVPARAAGRAAEDRVREPPQQPLVRLRAERVERERAGAAALVADRGHAALVDRQLEVQRADPRDDLGLRRAGGQQPRRARRRGCAAAGAPEPPNADRSSVTSATRAIANRTARRRRRRLALEVPASASRGTRRWGPGGGIGGTVADVFLGVQRGSSARAPSDGERPVPVGRPDRHDPRCSIGSVSALGRPPRIEVPRWVQLVGLPLLLVLAWVLLDRA